MRLDGYDVTAGDAVYDLYFGDGRVHSVTADGHMVVTYGNRMFTYDGRGIGQHGRRSLYWHNPVLVIPAKDEREWSLQKRLNAYARAGFARARARKPRILRERHTQSDGPGKDRLHGRERARLADRRHERSPAPYG
ncbi:hypothetical protein [Paraburkholderia caribensis]|uniref:hypothetical protein n=1 Tax=Paraburkholderia caribensis TaxID=75105 RepID=UPI0028565E6B|nr:hypothetical protein [Paraburkholderia caribensis]MDR6384944.1 hypothetical protein [Paraburkholderia caribensis]